MSANPVVPNQDPTSLDTVQFPSGHQMSIPSALPQDSKDTIAATAWEHMKGAGSSFLGAFGLPSTGAELTAANAQLGSQLSHPLDSAEKIASATGSALKGMVTSDPAMLNKARAAWQSGDHVEAARHFLNYLTPLVGRASDQAGDEVQSGEYGKALGHTAAAVLPMLFGKLGGSPETAAGTAEATPEIGAMHQTVDPEMWGDITTDHLDPKVVKAAKPAPAGGFWRGIDEEHPPVEKMSDSAAAAAAYLRKIGADRDPASQVEVQGMADSDPHEINIGGRTSSTRTLPVRGVDNQVQIQAEAQKLLDQIQAEHMKAADPVEQLQAIRQRLGLTGKPSGEAVGASKTPVTAADVARLKTRGEIKTEFSSEPSENGLYTNHTVRLMDKGKSQGFITALEDSSEPNVLRIANADVTPVGTNIGRDFGYPRLFQEAQKIADKSGKESSVVGGSVQSESAKATWQALKKQGFPVEFSDEGQPSVTFTPKKPAAPKVPANWAEALKTKAAPKAPAPSTRIGRTMNTATQIPLHPESQDIDLTDEWK